MAADSIRIGGASGFWGDSQTAVPQLLQGGDVQFIVFDYLAELTMSLLAAAQAKNPEMGWAGDFVEQLRPHLSEIARRNIKLVSNAGGVNPAGCAAELGRAAHTAGVTLKIAVVEGDNALPLVPQLRDEGVREIHTGATLPGKVTTANAYLGATPIRTALDAGADVVITGRCVDSAVTLGVLMHAFGWREDEYDKLAQGSLAGHVIECGCQATGGLHTDWRRVPGWANMGYPVIEAQASGCFIVTKPPRTGGLISVPSIAEQILYEVGDPARYILPDVVCDFTQLKLTQLDAERVQVEGARGLPATDSYKVCATYPDGFRATAQLTVVGFEAPAKARRTAEAVLERTRQLFAEADLADYSATLIEILGEETGHGPHATGAPIHEAVMRLAVAHADKRALELFAREIASSGTSWAPGTTGLAGRPAVTQVLKQYSFLLDKRRLPVHVRLGDTTLEVSVRRGEPLPPREPDRADIQPAVPEEMAIVPLIALAWARSGDKGDQCNVGVLARSPQLAPVLRREVTPERVQAYLAHLVKGSVTRFEVPGLDGFNFLLDRALDGGGMASLRNDPWGKGMAQILLTMPVTVPARLVPQEGGTG